MVSTAKRMKYVFEKEESTSEEESYDTDCAPNDIVSPRTKIKSRFSTVLPDFKNKLNNSSNKTQRSGRKPKCFSRNALMARENRLKKKMYISKLEKGVTSLKNDNKKLSTIVDNQSYLISELKKEVKYLKSVVSNSSDLCNLIRNIHQSTGMSVSSSLDKNLSLKNICIPKRNPPIARKTAHPWEEVNQYSNYPTPESNHFSSPDHGLSDELTTDFLNDIPLTLPINIPKNELLNGLMLEEENLDDKSAVTLEEHNYNATRNSDMYPENDVGVCLHVSKHRVSLEFCPSCSENASQSWMN